MTKIRIYLFRILSIVLFTSTILIVPQAKENALITISVILNIIVISALVIEGTDWESKR